VRCQPETLLSVDLGASSAAGKAAPAAARVTE
jgi:hypothetical protein